MAVITINNEADFNEHILKSDKPALVDFWAPWCGPCKMVGPEVEAVAEMYEGKAIVAKINVDENQQLASEYNVMGVPTIVVLKNGKEVNRIVGYRPRKELGAALDGVL
ncbi:thioredoxin [Dendrosporobacter sp. 1207_IL3150]|uniref:thioredoxin n=1 Tax=Dendrosporobacter sp. 1207_IL3150 TaxID=3084054 RepID=UPI002FD9E4A9